MNKAFQRIRAESNEAEDDEFTAEEVQQLALRSIKMVTLEVSRYLLSVNSCCVFIERLLLVS